MCLGGFNLWKKLFGKNIILEKGSELAPYTLLTQIVGIRNVLQTQRNGSLASEWSVDMFGGFYRWKTKSFRFLQNDTADPDFGMTQGEILEIQIILKIN